MAYFRARGIKNKNGIDCVCTDSKVAALPTMAVDSDEATEVQTKPAPPKQKPTSKSKPARPHRKMDRMPQWRVLLHNDDVNDMGYIVDTLMGLTTLSFEDSYRCMFEAHSQGLSLVTVTHQERAELYRDQFYSKLILVSIEPMEE